MAQTLVRLAPRELALWLGLPLDSVQKKVRARVAEGRWRIISGDTPAETDRVELPAGDLNAELDAHHGDAPAPPPAPPAPDSTPDSRVAELEAELARTRRRNDELNRLLLQATHAIEETQARMPGVERHREEVEALTARNTELTDEVIEAKRALIAAFDRILELQHQVYGAHDDIAAAKEDKAAVDSIYAILEKLKNRRT
jgi:hypothetical protein